jgi:uncharacterized membrane protein YhaH (DUF805 family)
MGCDLNYVTFNSRTSRQLFLMVKMHLIVVL